jgi:hypothetical protein
MISTRNLESLLDIDELKKFSQSLAMIDFLRSNNEMEWGAGQYYFYPSKDKSCLIATMDNDQGSYYDINFYNFGAIIIGFEARCPMNPFNNGNKIWKGVVDNVPSEFKISFNDTREVDGIKLISYCIWKKYSDKSWNIGNINFPDDEYNDSDGSKAALFLLDGNRERYLDFARNFYFNGPNFDEKDKIHRLNPEIINFLFDHKPLNEEIVKKINPNILLSEKKQEILEIGYYLAD